MFFTFILYDESMVFPEEYIAKPQLIYPHTYYYYFVIQQLLYFNSKYS